mmetsp:Transcript_39831/g.86183  ORF Transcript_39831/g.86183 Transcript_39831/m.86183 type:complete len:278 (-) Transcript_39831:109-942(-)
MPEAQMASKMASCANCLGVFRRYFFSLTGCSSCSATGSTFCLPVPSQNMQLCLLTQLRPVPLQKVQLGTSVSSTFLDFFSSSSVSVSSSVTSSGGRFARRCTSSARSSNSSASPGAFKQNFSSSTPLTKSPKLSTNLLRSWRRTLAIFFSSSCFLFSSSASFSASCCATLPGNGASDPTPSAAVAAGAESTFTGGSAGAFFRETQRRRGSFCQARSTMRMSRSRSCASNCFLICSLCFCLALRSCREQSWMSSSSKACFSKNATLTSRQLSKLYQYS